MLFRIEVRQTNSSWKTSVANPSKAGWNALEREGSIDEQGYPIPPPDESAQWPAAWLPLCEETGAQERTDAYDRFLQEQPRQGKTDVEALGGYLFAVLLGKHWADIKNAAENEAIRLQLVLPQEAIWHSLPWELMVDSEGPLAAFKKTIAITRLIQPDKAQENKLSIDIPIRVLFVVGRELDSQLRPGAEYLSLLRQMQCTLETQGEARGVALHTRLLMEATTQDVENAVQEFKPAVVHLISHGQISGKDSVVVLTRYETAARRDPKPDLVNATRLATLLRASDEAVRPHAVVLNACNTARIGDVQASFAGALVKKGIPLVVGMAGEVADAACRLFTTQFYAALVEQRSADIAAAEGRRAALLHFRNYTQNFDWARAVLYQADGVETQFKIVAAQASLIKVAEDLRPKKNREPFCGRLQWLPVFRDLFQRRIANLAIESDEDIAAEGQDRPQIGKSRLLDEFLWLSIFEGWIPIRIAQARATKYSNLLHFGVHLFTLMETTRDKFEVKRANRSEVVRSACAALNLAYDANDENAFLNARDNAIKMLEPQQKLTVTHDTIVQLLRRDLENLKKDIEAVVGMRKGVLIVWDQLDYEEAIEEDLVGLLETHGIGAKTCPAPVVFTYVKKSTGGKKLLTAINANSNVEIRNIRKYEDFETSMACRQFLAWKKYVPARLQPPVFEKAITQFETQIKGYPSNLFQFDQAIGMLVALGILVQFDDVQIMKEFS